MLGIQSVGPYMQARQAQKLEDWTEVPLDSDGKQIQEEMTRKFQVCFAFIMVSSTKH